jgi:acetylornithine deacetylase/succinyl-diaminopimelate desuccinylase-like protein
VDDLDRYVDEHAGEYVEMLQEMVRQPSVAAQGVGMAEMSAMVERLLGGIGASPRQYDTRGGFPVVHGTIPGRSKRTLSFYNHYDVQPAEPLELWESDPWRCQERDGRLWGRGVADNKGNLAARIAAVDAWRRVRGELPLSITFLVEGEEEIGSPHLAHFTEDHPDLCRADGCIWEFGGVDLEGRPLIHLGLKGMCYVELRVRGAAEDQHSSVATSVPNAAWRLVWALGSLKGPEEQVRIPGFYDRVRPPTDAERTALERMPDTEALKLEKYGIDRFLLGLTGMELKLRDYFEPTCTIAGFESGYTGKGTKTVLPARATAKVDMRLVADQDPNEIAELLRRHLAAEGFDDVEVTPLSMLYPARTPLDSPLAQVVIETYRELYEGEPVVVPTSAGSGPWYQLLTGFGIDGCTAGVGHPRSNAHAPNENIYVADYVKGIKHVCRIMERFALAGESQA